MTLVEYDISSQVAMDPSQMNQWTNSGGSRFWVKEGVHARVLLKGETIDMHKTPLNLPLDELVNVITSTQKLFLVQFAVHVISHKQDLDYISLNMRQTFSTTLGGGGQVKKMFLHILLT